MTGDQNDVLARLQRWLPQGWFPTATGTRIYAILSGFASVLSSIYAMVAYTKLQTRIATATDGFLDLISQDYLGSNLPRLPGETDAAFSARIRANIFLAANTRTAIQNALQNVTGAPVRMIEPWQPNDTFVWGKSFWNVNTAQNPGQWSNGNARYVGMIQCSLPQNGAINLPRSWWGRFFWGFSASLAPAAGAWWLALSSGNSQSLIFAALQRLKVFGTSIYVQFVSPPAATVYLTDPATGLDLLDPATGRPLTLP